VITQTFGYNLRGELLSQSATDSNGGGNSSSSYASADGFLCTKDSDGTGCTQSWDAFNDELVNLPGVDPITGNSNTFSYGYDPAGENSSVSNSTSGTLTRVFDGNQEFVGQVNNGSTPFDCDSFTFNCVVTASGQNGNETDVEPTAGVDYTWGTEGHPVKAYDTTVSGSPPTTSYATYWEHWNPATNDVIFETTPPGQLADLALGTLGESNASNGVEVEDRDPFGTVAASHDANSFSAFNGYFTKVSYVTRFGFSVNTLSGLSDGGSDLQAASRLYFGHGRIDEYDDSLNGVAFQGVRAVDENTGQWMSQDQFGGYADNPMSQMPYTWNNNNGLAYQDPSGFCGSATIEGRGNPGDPWSIPVTNDVPCGIPYSLPPINQTDFSGWNAIGPDLLEGRLDFLSQLTAATQWYRDKEMRSCNGRGGVFIDTLSSSWYGVFECSVDASGNARHLNVPNLECNMRITTFATDVRAQAETGIKVERLINPNDWPFGDLPDPLPAAFWNTAGIKVFKGCGYHTYPEPYEWTTT